MRTLLLLILPLAAVVPASADQSRLFQLKKSPAEIRVDGLIEEYWSQADSAAEFFQLQPYYAQPPSTRTVARLLTTDEALYCLIVAYQPEEYPLPTGLLDQDAGDAVSLMLDTFNDSRTAYKFAVTASGVRADCRMLDDARNRDYSWDGVWFADSRVYDWGYAVEMKVPYRSIRYDGAADHWGMDIDRWISTSREDLYWCEYDRAEGQRVSKFGRLVLNGFRPSIYGMNLEIYPVAFGRATYHDGSYDIDPSAGLDVFYNPSDRLTFQLTANPDFAQIEADPFEFNISRYESYFSERRPFFTEGNEVFMASGRDRNSGFYSPMELFYSRRIGKLLPDGAEVPLQAGTKAFGRLGEWEYGGFLARTGRTEYTDAGERKTEEAATFFSGRLKRNILDNSSVGVLFVGKKNGPDVTGVLDIDGAFRTSTWQLAYQLARSIGNGKGDFAGSAGFMSFGNTWLTMFRSRIIGNEFDVEEVGFVPWTGTAETVGLTGPVWYFESGYVRQVLLYAGGGTQYEHEDLFTDAIAILGFNMQFRDNWGFEINLSGGPCKDSDVRYTAHEVSFSSWYNTSPLWNGGLWGGWTRTYNFSREYVAPYWWVEANIEWKASNTFEIGSSYGMYTEYTPAGDVVNVTYNARPYVSVTPVNDLNARVYVDNLYTTESDRLQHLIAGFLFSYNFLPKSWIYLAINEVRERGEDRIANGVNRPGRLEVANRAAVLKVKYLYYF
jgi:hypothetical protein